MAGDSIRRILVIHVSRIGDTLLATPALRAIAMAYPSAQLTVFAHPKRAEILRNLPFVAQVGTITKHLAPFLGRLGRSNYDIAFVYGHDHALIRYALRIARRVVAFRQDDSNLDSRLDPSVPAPPRNAMHAVDSLLLLPEAIGIPVAGRRLAYKVSEAEAYWAQAELAKRLPADAHPLIGLQVASFPTKAWRDWPIEHFIALCERIVTIHPKAQFLILGGTKEQERTELLKKHFPSQATLFAGKLTLRQAAAIMSRLDLYIGVDTGPTHIMGTFDIPLVGLYHCESPSRIYGPLEHPRFVAIDHPARDAPGRAANVPMGAISVDVVYKAVIDALAGIPGN